MEPGWAEAGGWDGREGDSGFGNFVVEREAIGLERNEDFEGLDLGEGSRAAVFMGEPEWT